MCVFLKEANDDLSAHYSVSARWSSFICMSWQQVYVPINFGVEFASLFRRSINTRVDILRVLMSRVAILN